MNRLQQETSPYLLQHAHNPVDWYAWKEEAFARAKAENKPILVSIGYSTCHWCHVMERESFENETVAAFMNQHFINIKVDREERPDVDQIYMAACQLINGSGGWPLNCFLLPDGRPFYAGTYYPPQAAYNRPSWLQVLQNLNNAYLQKREVVEDQANRLIDAIQNSGQQFVNADIVDGAESSAFFTPAIAENIYYKLRERFDRVEGGFGGAPKFPETMSLKFLLHYYHFTGSEEAFEHLQLSLQKMMDGGIYDHLGGGFARYATDRAWLIPHFEKMLYDNALLIDLLSEVYRVRPEARYAEVIRHSLDFIEREMTQAEGLFFSALDADSEGEEGKFYVWHQEEIVRYLVEDADLFMAFYDISEGGNWEGKNILWRPELLEQFSEKHGISTSKLEKVLARSRAILLEARASRIRPGLDDKSLLDWNALMISAYAAAYRALGDDRYRTCALRALDALLKAFKMDDDTGLLHTYKDGQAQYRAFLDDYAYLIRAMLDVYEVTFDAQWLEKAEHYLEEVKTLFYDPKDGLFYFTGSAQSDVVVRTKELYDNATPSGNAIMADNFRRLGILLDQESYKAQGRQMLLRLQNSLERYPSSFGQWACSMLYYTFNVYEIAVTGPEAMALASSVGSHFLPGSILMASTKASDYPLLQQRFDHQETRIFVCEDYTCRQPVKTIEDFKQLVQ